MVAGADLIIGEHQHAFPNQNKITAVILAVCKRVHGNSVIDALLRYYVKGGGFKHIMDSELDGMATEQAYYALTAYYRFLDGKTNLYDMTDVIDMGGDVVTVEPTVPATTEPAQANTPWWIIAVCIFGGVGWGIVIGVVLVPKLKKKD